MTATGHRALAAAVLLALVPGVAAAARPSRSAEEAWAAEIRRRGLDPAALANPVAVSEEMRQAARAISGGGESAEQLARLQRYLFDTARFPFRYDARATLTAAEAFAERRGNCVAFTNLFIALGRSLGVPLAAGLLYLAESEVDEGLVVVNNHLVAVHRRQGILTLYDFATSASRSPGRFEVIDDLWLTAIYLNNLGVEALRAGDFPTAAERLETAIRLAPQFIAPYANLGVVRRQLGDYDGAFEVYGEVLAVHPRSPTVLANLARLYQDLGREEEARQALAAADLGGAPAHVLIARGNLELAQGDVKEALRLFKRARRLVPDLPEPWLAIGRLELQRGRPAAARRALERALAVAPDDPAAHRLAAESRYFEDFDVGERFVLPSRTLGEAHFLAFQAASGDNHPIHYDRPYCRRRGHRDLLAHGFQVLIQTAAGAGLFPHLVEDSLLGFIEQSSRFLAPVYAGDTVYAALEVTERVAQRTTGVLALRSTVHNQDGVLVMEGEQKYLLRRRDAAPR